MKISMQEQKCFKQFSYIGVSDHCVSFKICPNLVLLRVVHVPLYVPAQPFVLELVLFYCHNQVCLSLLMQKLQELCKSSIGYLAAIFTFKTLSTNFKYILLNKVTATTIRGTLRQIYSGKCCFIIACCASLRVFAQAFLLNGLQALQDGTLNQPLIPKILHCYLGQFASLALISLFFLSLEPFYHFSGILTFNHAVSMPNFSS